MKPTRNLILLFVLLFSACRNTVPQGEGPEREGARLPERIAVLAPAAAEMMTALGALEHVVAVGDFVEWPERLARLPHIGAYDTPNVEVMLALRVDLLVTSYGEATAGAHRRLRRLGIEVLPLDTETLDAVFRSIGTLGRATGHAAEADSVIGAMRERMEEIRAASRELPRRRVLCVVGTDPLYVAGPGSHLDAVIAAAGGENIFGDARSPYQMVSLETALERRPEVILNISESGLGGGVRKGAGYWGRWSFLPAVENGEVYWIHPQRLVVPGPRIPEMAELVRSLIHPERFGEAEPEEMGPLPGSVKRGS